MGNKHDDPSIDIFQAGVAGICWTHLTRIINSRGIVSHLCEDGLERTIKQNQRVKVVGNSTSQAVRNDNLPWPHLSYGYEYKDKGVVLRMIWGVCHKRSVPGLAGSLVSR